MKLKLFAIIGAAVLAVIIVVLAASHLAAAPAKALPTPSRSAQPSNFPPRSGTVSGTVTTSSGPGSKLPVQITYSTGQPFGINVTDANGHYSFTVPSGNYIILVKTSKYSKSAPVAVTAGQTTTLDLTVEPVSH